MSNAAKYRKKAAEFEQLKQIDRAIAAYVKAIEESETAGEDVDVALFNKVGDLALRQGRVPDAITYYERAVEHYATSGLFNNAIALCNKILRNAPGRSNVYFTLGRICARKRLRGDATRNFLEYATRMQQEGRIEEGIRALAEVSDLMPELTDVRTLVEEHATRAGIALPRRKTPMRSERVSTPLSNPSIRDQKSQDLIFLDVDYGDAARGSYHRTPVRTARIPTPPPLAVIPTTMAPTPATPVVEVIEALIEEPPAIVVAEVLTLDDLEETVVPESPTPEPQALPFLVEPDEVAIAPLEGLEANGEFVPDTVIDALDGFTSEEVVLDLPEAAVATPADVQWIVPPEPATEVPLLADVEPEDFGQAIDDPSVARLINSQTPLMVPAVPDDAGETPLELEPLEITDVPELDAAIAAGAELVARAEADAPVVSQPTPIDALEAVEEQLAPYRPPFRLDPHDFILPGELPPLLLGEEIVDAGLATMASGSVAHSTRGAEATPEAIPALPSTPSNAGDVLASEGTLSEAATAAALATDVGAQASPESTAVREDAGDVFAEAPLAAEDAEAAVESDVNELQALDELEAAAPASEARPVSSTPALPIAAVAAEATNVATSRRDSLRLAVSRLPQNWLLRRRLAEALFEAGERDAALAELETAQTGLVNEGEFTAASDIADELVQVSPDRVPYHQKRVELAVRTADLQRLRFAYLDLADALVRMGEEGRARAVYARVLEIDPHDDRARSALGTAAPPLPPERPDDAFVDLADWLRDDGAPATTRMRMREPVISGDEQADFDSLLRHFKEGVSRSLGEDDFESHYDLGVAYKEMGLLDDAIAEFQKALRSRSHRLPAYEALGQCFVEQGRHQVAATVLSRALHEPGLDDNQRVGVLYLLAYSCEALQRRDEARSYYQRVYATDINFRDAAARLAALEQAPR